MSTIRLIDPATVRELNRQITAGVQAFHRGMRDFGARLWHGIAAEAEQRRRDRDDELDWLGEWGGRRG